MTVKNQPVVLNLAEDTKVAILKQIATIKVKLREDKKLRFSNGDRSIEPIKIKDERGRVTRFVPKTKCTFQFDLDADGYVSIELKWKEKEKIDRLNLLAFFEKDKRGRFKFSCELLDAVLRQLRVEVITELEYKKSPLPEFNPSILLEQLNAVAASLSIPVITCSDDTDMESYRTINSGASYVATDMESNQTANSETSNNENAETKKKLSDELRHLAALHRLIQLHKLREKRTEQGYQHFMHDLRSDEYNFDGEGWSLTKGLLTVDIDNPTAITSAENYVSGKFEELRKPWFEKPSIRVQAPSLIDDKPYAIHAKFLGKNGANRAVDPVLLITKSDGSVSVVTIERWGGQERAFPGGMLEASVKEICINEILEECFSGDLFAEGSMTSKELNDRKDLEIHDLERIIREILNDSEFDKLKNKIDELFALPTEQSHSDYLRDILCRLAKLTDGQTGLDEPTAVHLSTRLKCRLYEHLFPVKYFNFRKLILDNLVIKEEVINGSDPRNTDKAWMVTKPLIEILTSENFAVLEKQCSLKLAGGDDALGANLTDIEKLFDGNFYSDHGAILLEALADALDPNNSELQLDLSQSLQDQIDSIRESILKLFKSSKTPQSRIAISLLGKISGGDDVLELDSMTSSSESASKIGLYNELVDEFNYYKSKVAKSDWNVQHFAGIGGVVANKLDNSNESERVPHTIGAMRLIIRSYYADNEIEDLERKASLDDGQELDRLYRRVALLRRVVEQSSNRHVTFFYRHKDTSSFIRECRDYAERQGDLAQRLENAETFEGELSPTLQS